MSEDKRKNIDLLVDHFWKLGYMSISRRFGRYLPEPENIGSFQIDIVAKYKKDYAIGITVSEDDTQNPAFLEKIFFLATRQTRFSNQPVQLIVGVPSEIFKKVKYLIENIDHSARKNIRVVQIKERIINNKKTPGRKNLFS